MSATSNPSSWERKFNIFTSLVQTSNINSAFNKSQDAGPFSFKATEKSQTPTSKNTSGPFILKTERKTSSKQYLKFWFLDFWSHPKRNTPIYYCQDDSLGELSTTLSQHALWRMAEEESLHTLGTPWLDTPTWVWVDSWTYTCCPIISSQTHTHRNTRRASKNENWKWCSKLHLSQLSFLLTERQH